MTNEEILKIAKRAKNVAIKRGYPELADDFSQEIVVHYLSGKGRHQTVDQFFIDYLRSRYGDSRNGRNRVGNAAERNYIELDEVRNLADHSGDDKSDRNSAHYFTGKELTLYHLYFEEQMREAHIGALFGVTESRISQMLNPMKKKIQNQAILEQGFERMEWDESFLNFQIDWVSI